MKAAARNPVLELIQIDPQSPTPLRRQIVNQIVVLIASGKLRPGQMLPSVRQVERLLKIHRHTVSRAYHELVDESWLIRTPGKRLQINSFEIRPESVHDLSGFVDMVIQLAGERGYTLEQIHECLSAHLAGGRPNHVLVASTDPGLAEILAAELEQHISVPIRTCRGEDLPRESSRIPGALVVWVAGGTPVFRPSVAHGAPYYSVTIRDPADLMGLVRDLREPSVIAVASVSPLFLERAIGVIAPLVGNQHSLSEHLLPKVGQLRLDGADLVFCDSLSSRRIRAREVHEYRVISSKSIQDIRNALQPK